VLWLEFLQGHHPDIQDFGPAREQLWQRVKADPTNPFLVTAIAYTDLALGRKEESIQEGPRAMEMRPISEDAVDGPVIAADLAVIYAWAGHLDIAFEELNELIKTPGLNLNYGDLKNYPDWDPLRNDPRFDKLLAELAPRD
jgi:hypothetical protein